MPAYFYYSALRGTQTTVDGAPVDYNYAPPLGGSWVWTGPSTSFVLVEENSAGQLFNGDEDANEYVDVNDRIGGYWGQHVTIDGTDRQVIWDYTFELTLGATTYRVGVIDIDLNNDNDLQDAGEDGYFLVFPDGFPPENTALTVGGIVENDASTPHGPDGLNAKVVCFAEGTAIDTPAGPRRVEDLRAGEPVDTLDSGARPLLWRGVSEVAAEGPLRPVVFEPGALGNARRLTVSPQHAMLVCGAEAQLLSGESEVLVRAVHLAGRPGIHRRFDPPVIRYHHLLFDRHELVLSEGVPSESLFPGPQTLAALDPANRARVLKRIGDPAGFGPMARPVLTRAEALCLPGAALAAGGAKFRRNFALPAGRHRSCGARGECLGGRPDR